MGEAREKAVQAASDAATALEQARVDVVPLDAEFANFQRELTGLPGSDDAARGDQFDHAAIGLIKQLLEAKAGGVQLSAQWSMQASELLRAKGLALTTNSYGVD